MTSDNGFWIKATGEQRVILGFLCAVISVAFVIRVGEPFLAPAAAAAGLAMVSIVLALIFAGNWRRVVVTLLVGAIAGLGAWWLVPDAKGTSRFEARRSARRLGASFSTIEPGDSERFHDAHAEFTDLTGRYPEYGSVFSTDAVARWFDRTVEVVVQRSTPWLESDPPRALKDRLELMTRLKKFDKILESAPAVDKLFHSCLEAAKVEAVGSIRRDRFAEALERATAFRARVNQIQPSANHSLAADRFLDSIGFLADLERLAAPAKADAGR